MFFSFLIDWIPKLQRSKQNKSKTVDKDIETLRVFIGVYCLKNSYKQGR